ncbi:MAG: LuxR C-terminal-related transcriptional regulator [Bacillota bacterium]|nr:LuxR C-terminal-related transcriptional regulator [Bacillota bacterium]MDW7678166.1 LuxR C-terminal-related transcriptional regulator [Bacillota bacterium]
MKEKKTLLTLVQQPQHQDLLLTKINMPRLHDGLIQRPRVLEEFDRVVKPGATWVVAPAGYGKTISVTEWLRSRGIPTAWYTMDEADNDLEYFCAYLVSALDSVMPSMSKKFRPLMESLDTVDPGSICQAVLQELEGFSGPLAVVLDDFHVIREPLVHRSLLHLLKLPRLYLLLLSRRPSRSLPWEKMEQKRLRMILSDTLRFDNHEIRKLAGHYGLHLSPHQLKVVETRTEGWAMGLALAFRNLRHSGNSMGLLETLLYQDNTAAYLTDEVLSQWDGETQEFLLKTSILDRMTVPLCEAVTGRKDSGQMLKRLADDSHLIITLHRRKGWYRYHKLLASFLKNRLMTMQKPLARDLYQRAATYYEARHIMDQAVLCYLKAHNYGKAGSLIEKMAPRRMQGSKQMMTLKMWLKRIPADIMAASLPLLVIAGWLHLIDGHPDRTQKYIRQAERLNHDENNHPDICGYLWQQEIELKLLQANHARLTGDLPAAAGHMRAVLNEVGFKTAYPQISRALTLPDMEHSLLASRYGFHGHLSLLKTDQGWLFNGIHRINQAAGCGLWLLEAEIHYERNELKEAVPLLMRALGQAESEKLWGLYVPAVILLTRVMTARGAIREAPKNVEKAVGLLKQAGLDNQVCRLEALGTRLKLERGTLKDITAWMENCGLTLCQQPDAGSYFAHGVHVRALIDQQFYLEAWLELEQMLAFSEQQNRLLQQVESLTLMAVCHYHQGGEQDAVASLHKALALAHPQAYCRIFVDEGARIYPVLKALIQQKKNGLNGNAGITDYAQTLLDETRRHVRSLSKDLPSRPAVSFDEFIEPLTTRENQVLQLLASGLTNGEIGKKLSIKQTTVKVHTRNIYGKLMVTNRNQAIQVAREKGLIR